MSKKYENCMFVEHVESAIYDLPNNIQKIDEIVLATRYGNIHLDRLNIKKCIHCMELIHFMYIIRNFNFCYINNKN